MPPTALETLSAKVRTKAAQLAGLLPVGGGAARTGVAVFAGSRHRPARRRAGARGHRVSRPWVGEAARVSGGVHHR